MVYLHERGEKATRKSSYFEAAGQRTKRAGPTDHVADDAKTCWPRRDDVFNVLAPPQRA